MRKQTEMRISKLSHLFFYFIPCIANDYPSQHEIILSDHYCDLKIEIFLEQYPLEKEVVVNKHFEYEFKVTINFSEDLLIRLIYGNGSPELFAKFFSLYGKHPLAIITEENNLFNFQYGENWAEGNFRMLYAGSDTVKREGRLIYSGCATMRYGLTGNSVVDLCYKYNGRRLILKAMVFFKSGNGWIIRLLLKLGNIFGVADFLNKRLQEEIGEIFDRKIENYEKTFENNERLHEVNLNSTEIIYIKNLLQREIESRK